MICPGRPTGTGSDSGRSLTRRPLPARDRPPLAGLGHCYIALFLALYHLGYIAPAKLLYSKGAISILCYIAICYIAIL